jgi:hypothetical protein
MIEKFGEAFCSKGREIVSVEAKKVHVKRDKERTKMRMRTRLVMMVIKMSSARCGRNSF